MYIELHTASGFSFLDGASQPEDLVARAARLGYPALALCDRDGVYGAPRFHKAAVAAGIRPLIGCEISLHPTDFDNPPATGESADPGAANGTALGNNGSRFTVHGSRTTTHPPRLTVLVANRRGYRNLCRLLTKMHLRSPKDEGRACPHDFEECSDGLIALLDDWRYADRLQAVFGRENLYVEIQRHFRREQERANHALIDFARRRRLPLLATNGVRYAKPSGHALYDVLTCLREKTVLDQAGRRLEPAGERYLKSPREMERIFRDLPDAVRNTTELAARLDFTLQDLGYEFPRYPVPEGESQMSHLAQVTDQGARERYRPYYERARRQIEHELRVIEKLNLPGYFLIVWDMIRFCRENKILAQGRGSAANSAVCYSLGITAVDPVGMDLLFERFLSEERGEWPDIDIDLPSGDQREKVLQHVYNRYGPRGAGMTANVITYRGKSAVREVGKVLGFPEEMIARLSKCIHSFEYTDDADKLGNQIQQAGLDAAHPRVRHLVRLCLEIQNLPRHLGQHSGGMVVCRGDLDAVVPLENARMPGRVVVQWDKDDCADLGIIKVDLLGLGMMAALEESIEIIRSRGGEIDLAHLPPDDPKTYEMIQKADTVGTFQIESRAQMATLPRLKPKCFYDLVVEVAIIRPGPIVGKMVHPYINRRLGREPVTYPHPSLEPILKRTLGVPLFQEQLLRLAMVAADFTGGEAEELRRAMGFKRSSERMHEIEQKLRRGLAANSIHGEAAEQIVRSITSFALYGFPESHAASFALLAYASCYLKAHHPEAFYTALLNCQPMGFYSPAVLVKDAQRHGIRIRPIDVQVSDVSCGVEDPRTEETGQVGAEKIWGLSQAPTETVPANPSVSPARSGLSPIFLCPAATGSPTGPTLGLTDTPDRPAVRLGLMYVSGLRAEAAETIVAERRRKPFTSIDDFVRRVKLRKPELDVLAEIGALNSLEQGIDRRAALWQIEKSRRPKGPLWENETATDTPAGPSSTGDTASRRHGVTAHDPSPLAPMTPFERLDADYRGAGLTTGPHPMHYLREAMNALGVVPAAALESQPNGRRLRVAGAVITRQRPGTAKGFVFLTLEDETGVSNVIVTPDKFQQWRILVTGEPFLFVEGDLQKQDGVIHVRARKIERLGDVSLDIPSHDFH